MADTNRRSTDGFDDDRADAEFADAEFADAEFADEDAQPAADRGGSRSAGGRQATRAAGARTRQLEEQRPGLIARIVNFIREVVAELQKVIWPTRTELLTYTAVVLVFVTAVMTFVALLDVGFAKAMFLVFGSATE